MCNTHVVPPALSHAAGVCFTRGREMSGTCMRRGAAHTMRATFDCVPFEENRCVTRMLYHMRCRMLPAFASHGVKKIPNTCMRRGAAHTMRATFECRRAIANACDEQAAAQGHSRKRRHASGAAQHTPCAQHVSAGDRMLTHAWSCSDCLVARTRV